MKRIYFCIILLLGVAAYGQDTYGYGTFVGMNGELPFRYLEPVKIKHNKKYPIVLFLHGAGERGTDNEKQLIHCSEQFLNPVNRERYPAYVFFPQAPEGDFWSVPDRLSELSQDFFANVTEPSWQLKTLKDMLDSIMNIPNVDIKRIYIMGISMGAMAAYEMCWRWPELFAAAVPICGGADIVRLKAACDVSWRIYHGDADKVVPVNLSRMAYKSLKSAGAKVLYREFSGCSHNSWNPAFNDEELMPWLFKQKK